MGRTVEHIKVEEDLRSPRAFFKHALGYSKLYMGYPRASFFAISNLQIKFIHVYVWELFLVQGLLL